jgi:signal transduction histidine kinase
MPLRWKMAALIACMIVGLLLVSAAAMWGINGLHQDYGVALARYQELREIYGEVGSHLTTARELLVASPYGRGRAATQLDLAEHKLELLAAQSSRLSSDPQDVQARNEIQIAIAGAVRQLHTGPDLIADFDLNRSDTKAVDEALLAMRTFASRVERTIQARQADASAKRNNTLLIVGCVCGAVVIGAVGLGILQYRSVVLPLNRLGQGVRKIAAGEFKQRLSEKSGREFVELANEFNRMAAELDEFYHRLEQKVADKSRQLIRSERLASVGYLAAGVAHEINNPLGIIAGYAEYSLEQIRKNQPLDAGELAKSFGVICDESFRCKDIIGKLLTLARPGNVARQEIDLAQVAAEVVSAAKMLPDCRDRDIIVANSAPARIDAVEAEMKQVVLNLVVNALQAVNPGGQVQVEVHASDGFAELRVRDNGRGMTAQLLEQVFEPFFTDKKGVREPGTGLGLSITHAIVQGHGGSISASSPGPGQGSEFVVRLPAVAQRSVA